MPGYGDCMVPPPLLERVVPHMATHCAHCKRERPLVAQIDGVWVCAQCKWAADIAASRAIEKCVSEDADAV